MEGLQRFQVEGLAIEINLYTYLMGSRRAHRRGRLL
jgi:hypothetical protein